MYDLFSVQDTYVNILLLMVLIAALNKRLFPTYWNNCRVFPLRLPEPYSQTYSAETVRGS